MNPIVTRSTQPGQIEPQILADCVIIIWNFQKSPFAIFVSSQGSLSCCEPVLCIFFSVIHHVICCLLQPKALLMLAKHGADVSIRNIHDETPFGKPCCSTDCYELLFSVAISEQPEIRQLLVDLQSGTDPDQLEAGLNEAENESATSGRKTRRYCYYGDSERMVDVLFIACL